MPWFELARFRRSRATKGAVVAIVLVPLIYGSLYVLANWNPSDNLDRLHAAVVNNDEIVTVGSGKDETDVALGRVLAAELVSSDDENNYDWRLTNAKDAAAGLADGDYAAVLTIPAEFSADAVSVSGNDATDTRTGHLGWETNDAYNYINGNITSSLAARATGSLSDQVTEQYLDGLYQGFNDTHKSLKQASVGAADLAAGSVSLASGAGRVSDGARQVSIGTTELAVGAGTLDASARQLAGGSGELSDATTQLAQGASALSSSARQLDQGATKVSRGAGQVAAGSRKLATNADALRDGATNVASGADQLSRGLDTTSGSANQVSAGAGSYAAQMRQLADACPPSPALATYCANVRQAAAGADQLAVSTTALATGVSTLATGADPLVAGSARVASGADDLADGAATLSEGASSVASGTRDVAAGAGRLSQGARRLNEGAGRTDDGAAQLTSGLGQLQQGTGTLASKSTQLAAGGVEVAAGADEVAAGSDDVATGSRDLDAGLAQGVLDVPTYKAEDRITLAQAAAEPVQADVVRAHAVKNNGAALAPYFSSLALWVGALAIYLMLRPLSARLLGTTTPAWRVALAGFVPGATLALVQVGLLVGVLELVVGIEAADPWRLLGVAVVTSVTFVAINQALIALFGSAGRFLALIFVALQLTAAGGTYPVETAPGFFSAISAWMPMTHAVQAMRNAIAGGDAAMAGDVAALVLWMVAALVVSTLAASKRRNVTQHALHPALVM
ncbi:YhgE/Pip domain-containing protein [Nocardioides piscis]|uniref:YhgE/Pip domain-containing protein n=1 Tax=Nocardioides piscis TaxID=2714938 RepID=A0A6G7YD43_9ACTN|nr:YhgE/Pip domain-containing protein [Nocardioides piscis]QIK74742.1 YhgE/Pip domain-containing protein [Nocardioides piscis]